MMSRRKKEQKKEKDIPIWVVVLSCLPVILISLYANLATWGIIDPYALQRREMTFTLRGFQYWEDPRWTQDRWLMNTDRGVFYLEGNFTEDQLNRGDTYRIIYKSVLGVGGDISFYYAFTLERVEAIG
jgi:hypothetical protein